MESSSEGLKERFDIDFGLGREDSGASESSERDVMEWDMLGGVSRWDVMSLVTGVRGISGSSGKLSGFNVERRPSSSSESVLTIDPRLLTPKVLFAVESTVESS